MSGRATARFSMRIVPPLETRRSGSISETRSSPSARSNWLTVARIVSPERSARAAVARVSGLPSRSPAPLSAICRPESGPLAVAVRVASVRSPLTMRSAAISALIAGVPSASRTCASTRAAPMAAPPAVRLRAASVRLAFCRPFSTASRSRPSAAPATPAPGRRERSAASMSSVPSASMVSRFTARSPLAVSPSARRSSPSRVSCWSCSRNCVWTAAGANSPSVSRRSSVPFGVWESTTSCWSATSPISVPS